ncbi:MAG: bifunctional [glutamine synthetase] adenylyltransferase/[glutamine synthetase]-adenylyl-L-tyrosine phosphorylase, partial [Actinomycetia bacterium]|nr:bifunctional [glutamine synthetase] adenylyltransferase/[glutamine synthetase]-adenylyl-L-tyrosine phosphorylase [Actinomycetes bacterium]
MSASVAGAGPAEQDPAKAAVAGASRTAQRLARLGFRDAAAAAASLTAPPLAWWDVAANQPDAAHAAALAAISQSANPDWALAALAALMTHAADRSELAAALGEDESVRLRLIRLLGASSALGDHLAAHPADWHALAGGLDPVGMPARLGAAGAEPELRAAYRRELVAIAGRDLNGELDVAAVGELLADLAGHTLRAALALAASRARPHSGPGRRDPDPAGPDRFRLAVIAMGKAGGRELNYVSDVDVIFVAEGDLDQASRIAAETMRICRAVAWEVDASLRPEGRAGPLVRTLASHAAYYQRWANTWEFQALLKARPVAGDAELGRQYLDTIAPLVWSAAERPDFVADVQAMRRRVVEHLPPELVDREIKLAAGGLRDVEFAVQLLQLVHGRGDETLRVAATLPALDALRDGGYVGRDDAARLADAYRFLRAAEHRLQLRLLRRTHLVPDDPVAVDQLARAMGLQAQGHHAVREVWQGEWARHTHQVRRLHEKLFYRPLLEAVARVPSEALRLTPVEAGRRLAALGFADPRGALGHIQALTAGLSRRAALQRALLPVLLGDFADAPSPDAGLRAYRQVSDELGATPWFLRLLRDEGAVASRLAYLLGTSQYVVRLLVRAPEALQSLGDDAALRPRRAAELTAAMAEMVGRHTDSANAVAAIRGVRRGELLRVAFADLLDQLTVDQACAAISATTDATLAAALEVARRDVAGADRIDFAVIAMGRLGGGEAGYGSDADVMFVFDARAPEGEPTLDAALFESEAPAIAHEVASRLRALLSAPSADPPLLIDADLRPEGRRGPLARSLASYARYYRQWSAPWEAQALLRARIAAGDRALGDRFLALIDPVRYPAGGLSPADVAEIRRIKGRVDAERLPRGADPATHLKLGRGGLADVEWTIQLLQLWHGHEVAALRTTSTRDA